jgi:hypothetical protein
MQAKTMPDMLEVLATKIMAKQETDRKFRLDRLKEAWKGSESRSKDGSKSKDKAKVNNADSHKKATRRFAKDIT